VESIDLNSDTLKFGIQTAFTLFHEVGHRVEDKMAPSQASDRIENLNRMFEGEAIAESFALMALADYLAAANRLDHLGDKEFYVALGMQSAYDTAIDTTDGRAFVNYMIDHPNSRSDNDPEVYRLAYAAGLAWVGQHAPYYTREYAGR
jgi:hypothetical protein